MNTATFDMFSTDVLPKKKCGNCGSTDSVKTVQIVRKGGKRKVTVQKCLCVRCRKNHQ